MSIEPLILASASPRRHQLLKQYEIEHVVHPAGCIEPEPQFNSGKTPAEFACYAAEIKALDLVDSYPNRIILAADSVVSLNGKILGKPADKSESRDMISSLSGNIHLFITGMYMILPSGQTLKDSSITRVTFRNLSEAEIDWYVSSNDGCDKAGAYGIQSLGGVLVESISGDWHNVVGLPIPLLIKWLHENCPGYWPSRNS